MTSNPVGLVSSRLGLKLLNLVFVLGTGAGFGFSTMRRYEELKARNEMQHDEKEAHYVQSLGQIKVAEPLYWAHKPTLDVIAKLLKAVGKQTYLVPVHIASPVPCLSLSRPSRLNLSP